LHSHRCERDKFNMRTMDARWIERKAYIPKEYTRMRARQECHCTLSNQCTDCCLYNLGTGQSRLSWSMGEAYPDSTLLLAPVPEYWWRWYICKSRSPARQVLMSAISHLVSCTANNGESHAPMPASVCQNGIRCDVAIISQAKPSSPETGGVRKPVDTASITPII